MMTFEQLIKDQDFLSLPHPEKKKVLMGVDKDFAGLPDEEQNKLLQGVGEKIGQPTWKGPDEPGLEEPGILGTLLNPAELATSIATGGISALRLGKPVLKEMASWATYGMPQIYKGVRGGIRGLLEGLSAKEIEKRIPPSIAAPIEKVTASTVQPSITELARKAILPEIRPKEVSPTSDLLEAARRATLPPKPRALMTAEEILQAKRSVTPPVTPVTPAQPIPTSPSIPTPTPTVSSQPTIRKLSKLEAFSDKTKRAFAPGTRGEEAQFASETVREMGGRIALGDARATEDFRQARTLIQKKLPDQQLQFIDAVEGTHPIQNLPLDEQEFALKIKTWSDNNKAELLKSGGVGAQQHWVDNYFPHLWKNPLEAAQILDTYHLQQASLKGGAGFLKTRKIPTYREALDLGLTPLYDNPIDNILARNHEVTKYIQGNKSIEALKDANYLKFVKSGDPRPLGYEMINDKISTVYAPRKSGGFIPTGHYFAPEKVATIFNRYLSPGLSYRLPTTFGLYRQSANMLNQFQLSLSAFHLGFTTLDVAISKAALSLNQLSRGEVTKAIKTASTVPVSPVTNIIQGDRLLKSALNPTLHPELAPIIEALQQGGGRVRMEEFYRTNMTRKMIDAWRRGGVIDRLSATLRVPGAAVEQVMRPILEWAVPRQKLGMFTEMMKYELERAPSMTSSQIRTVAGKIVDSLDNRLGQLTYDNLHWDKVSKDLALSSVRSVGWNVGTIREVGGGTYDLGKMAVDLVRGRRPDLSYRAAYTLTLPLLTGALGGLFNYGMTGEAPKELKDFYFPRTGGLDARGNPERVSLPSYMKDIYHYSTAPMQTVLSKVHPLVGMIGDMLNNQDFYGTEIVHKGDEIGKQFFDLLKFGGRTATPIAIKSMQRLSKEREAGTGIKLPLIGTVPTTVQGWLPEIGITPAPTALTKTRAQELASYYIGSRFPKKTLSQAERMDIVSSLEARQRQGEGISEEAWDAYQRGKITRQQWKGLHKAPGDQLMLAFKKLPFEDAQRVFEVATPEEKEKLKMLFLRKRIQNSRSVRGGERLTEFPSPRVESGRLEEINQE